MALQTYTKKLSDISGAEGAETVVFGHRGTSYEIDLTESEAARFDDAMAEFVGHARRIAGTRAARGTRKFTRPSSPIKPPTAASNGNGHGAKPNNDEVRAWAKRLGIPVADRGRIPGSVVDRFLAEGTAQPTPEPTPPAASNGASASKPIKRRSVKPSDGDLESVYRQAGSAEAVADHFGCTPQTARKWLADLAITA